MHKDGFPRGNPPDDCRKLELWWQEEMQKCGFSGPVTVNHVAIDGAPPTQSTAKQLFEAFVMRRGAAVDAHIFYTTIPEAPWPLHAVVLTTSSGGITRVIYRAILKCPLQIEATFRKTAGVMNENLQVEGPFAERLREMKPLLKVISHGLNRRYTPPQWGFAVSKEYFELKEASVKLRGCPEGTEAVVETTVREEMGIVRHRFTLGLNRAVDIFKAMERSV